MYTFFLNFVFEFGILVKTCSSVVKTSGLTCTAFLALRNFHLCCRSMPNVLDTRDQPNKILAMRNEASRKLSAPAVVSVFV